MACHLRFRLAMFRLIAVAIFLLLSNHLLRSHHVGQILESLGFLQTNLDEVYHSKKLFQIDYSEMEEQFKVYIYPHEEDPHAIHNTILATYASEAYFFDNIRLSKFLTRDPDEAHLFFIPISLQHVGHRVSSQDRLAYCGRKYVEGIIQSYPYWNRSMGADHFFLTCLENPRIDVPMLVKNSIRVLCSSTYKSDAVSFIPHKDVSLPATLQTSRQPWTAAVAAEQRTILGFWGGGGSNSNTRRLLVSLCGADDELDIQEIYVGLGPHKYLFAKFCICPVGSRISNSAITMAIHYGCVPVILGDHFDLPFNSVLDWRKFSLILEERDVYQLKAILKANEGSSYRKMYRNLIKVRRHFEWNEVPRKYDAFHMVMYHLWLRRHVVRY